MPFRPEVLPTFPLPGGAPGDCEQRKRLVSLETAGLPGVSHLAEAGHRLRKPPSRAYGFTAAGESSPPEPLRDSGRPDRSLAPSRFGATERIRHPTPTRRCQGGSPAGAPPESSGPVGRVCRTLPRGIRTPGVGLHSFNSPRPGSDYLVRRSPFAVATALGSSRTGMLTR
jgi:hypothetical protein